MMKMGRLALTLAVLFLSSVAFSCADDVTGRDLSEDPAGNKLPEDVLTTDDSIVKAEYEDPAASKRPEENEFRTIESNEEVTTVTFRPADHRLDGRKAMPVSFRHKRPCRHRRRPFNPSDLVAHSRQIPYGNDMIMATKEVDSDTKDSQEPIRWARFRHHHHDHHGEPEQEQNGQTFQMKWLSGGAGGDHEMKKFHRGYPHFEREDDEEEHRHHHRHKHHHHHHDEDDEEEKGGLLIKFRKFLMDRF